MKVGFIGLGKIGREHAAVVRHLGHTVYAGTTKSGNSDNWKAFEKEFPGVVYQTPTDMFDNILIDAIVIALPPGELEQYIPAILNCKKPMLIEKPFGYQDYSTTIGKYGMHMDNKFIAFNRRFYEPVIRLRHLTEEIKSVEVNISEPVKSKIERLGPGITHNLLLFSSIHVVDLILHLSGANLELKSVFPFKEESGFTSMTALATFKNSGQEDVPVVFNIHEDDPRNTGIIVRTAGGLTYSLEPLESLWICNGLTTIETDGQRSYHPQVVDVIQADNEFKPGLVRQMQTFLEDPTSKNLATLDDEMKARRFITELLMFNYGK